MKVATCPTSGRLIPARVLGMMALLLTVSLVPVHAQASKSRSPARNGRSARAGRNDPPACSHARRERPRRPPAQSMPEMFARMGESFARNPAMGFQSFLDDLAQLEGPALDGITLTRDEERRAGLRARDEYLRRAAARGAKPLEDPERLAYLRELVEGFAARMKHRGRYPEIGITLLDSPIPDGQSFPGGFLVFTRGLLDEPDEATVAGVVAHELAHLDLGHLYEYARRDKLAAATYSAPPGMGMDFDRFFTRQMALFGLLMNPFRPEHELEADCTSVTWLFLEGYDPRALVGFFERMHERHQDQPDSPFQFGRTHPYSLDRKRHVLGRLAQLQRWRPRNDLGLFAENLSKHVSRFRERAEAAQE